MSHYPWHLQNSVQSTSFFLQLDCLVHFDLHPHLKVCFSIDSNILSCLNVTPPSISQENLHRFAWLPVLLNTLFCFWMLKKQRYKWSLMELKAIGRFISDAFLRMSFSNLSSSKVVHFAFVETIFTKYCISSNNCLRHLLNFEAVKSGVY